MKILAVYTFSKKDISPVDRWRTKFPFEELRKNTDWQIDIEKQMLDIDKDTENIDKEEMEALAERLGQYDIVWSSYYSNKMLYALTKVVEQRYGTKFILDADDNIYNVPKHNPFWLMMNEELVWGMQRMIETVSYVTTTNKHLAKVYRTMREGLDPDTVKVIPNFISKKMHTHAKYDNKNVKIGYFGGSSHAKDLNNTNFSKAISAILKKHKDVTFELYGYWGNNKSVEGVIGTYLDGDFPKDQVRQIEGKRGEEWYKLFKKINLDIACGPLVNDQFNACKSGIKWMESSMMGACFIASNVKPYSDLIKDGEDGVIVGKNSYNAWYARLDELVKDKQLRQKLAKNAKKRVLKDHTIEKNWTVLKETLEEIHEDNESKLLSV